MSNVLSEYNWLIGLGVVGALLFGFGTGANDVANAFATSVGSKALKLWQASIIAAIFEFTGAIVLGRVNQNVISGGIAKPEVFNRDPEIYAWGMACALLTSGFWQIICSAVGLNVSSTQSIIGGILGFALVYRGSDAVNWATKAAPGEKVFPPYKGIVPIVCSWFFAPLATGLAAALIFLLCRTIVLRRKAAYKWAIWLLPIAVTLTSYVNIFFVFSRGLKKYIQKNRKWTDQDSSIWAAVAAAGLGVLSAVVFVPYLYRTIGKQNDGGENTAIDKYDGDKDAAVSKPWVTVDPEAPAYKQRLQQVGKALTTGLSHNIHQIVEDDPFIHAIHERAEKFDPRAEFVFSYLQVFSAICVIFAHGAGEVGYMSGPLGAIVQIVETGKFSTKVTPPVWCTLVSAFALVIGLATYGHHVTQAMGTMMAKLSPTRGFAAELATSLVILLASQYGLPTSSSQCITGGIVGVGTVEGIRTGVNWFQFGRQFVSWAMTLAIAIGLTGALFALGIFTPSKAGLDKVDSYEDGINNFTLTILSDLNKTLYSIFPAAEAGALPTLSNASWEALRASLNKTINSTKGFADLKKNPTVDPEAVFDRLKGAFAFFNNYSINTLGQDIGSVCVNASVSPILKGLSCPATKLRVPKFA